ncbi:hypothetical protein SAMN05661080_00494 [Modestobacter sp. DSM 44400]|nr:hypothetical protein SAMN05661080_00494 [Modestobacter sp. DSM 44400]
MIADLLGALYSTGIRGVLPLLLAVRITRPPGSRMPAPAGV